MLSWKEFLETAQPGDVFQFWGDSVEFFTPIASKQGDRCVVEEKSLSDGALTFHVEGDTTQWCFYTSNKTDREAVYRIVEVAESQIDKALAALRAKLWGDQKPPHEDVFIVDEMPEWEKDLEEAAQTAPAVKMKHYSEWKRTQMKKAYGG